MSNWEDGPSWRNPTSYVGSVMRETAEERDRRVIQERAQREKGDHATYKPAATQLTSLELVSEIAARSDQELEVQAAKELREREEEEERERNVDRMRQQFAISEQTSNPLGLHYEHNAPPQYSEASNPNKSQQSQQQQQQQQQQVPSYSGLQRQPFVSSFSEVSANNPSSALSNRAMASLSSSSSVISNNTASSFHSPPTGMFRWQNPASVLGQHLPQDDPSAPSFGTDNMSKYSPPASLSQESQLRRPPSQCIDPSTSSMVQQFSNLQASDDNQPPKYSTSSPPPMMVTSELPPDYEEALMDALGKENTSEAIPKHNFTEMFSPKAELPNMEHFFPDPKEKVRCASCFDPIVQDLAHGFSGLAVAKGISKYHLECYEKYSSPPCAYCGRTLYPHPEVNLSGLWGEYRGRNYHVECYQYHAGPRCCSCFNIIFADPTNNISGAWRCLDDDSLIHEECFQRRLQLKREQEERLQC